MQNEGPQFGQLIHDNNRLRDAVHIAVIPVTATESLKPGEHIGLVHDDNEHVGRSGANIGIVDPFLVEEVEPGQRFYLFLYPNTVTGMRHAWSHPAFRALPKTTKDGQA